MSNLLGKRDSIVDEWVRSFFQSALEKGVDIEELDVGYDGGDSPDGVKIIFEGYAESEDGSPDTSRLSFAIFIHRNSVNGEFPEHDSQSGMIIHRPSEEMHFFAWWDYDTDDVEVLPETEFAITNLDEEEAQQLFLSVIEKLGL
jgi:hypothetical protein